MNDTTSKITVFAAGTAVVISISGIIYLNNQLNSLKEDNSNINEQHLDLLNQIKELGEYENSTIELKNAVLKLRETVSRQTVVTDGMSDFIQRQNKLLKSYGDLFSELIEHLNNISEKGIKIKNDPAKLIDKYLPKIRPRHSKKRHHRRGILKHRDRSESSSSDQSHRKSNKSTRFSNSDNSTSDDDVDQALSFMNNST